MNFVSPSDILSVIRPSFSSLSTTLQYKIQLSVIRSSFSSMSTILQYNIQLSCRWLDPLFPVCPPLLQYNIRLSCRWFDPLFQSVNHPTIQYSTVLSLTRSSLSSLSTTLQYNIQLACRWFDPLYPVCPPPYNTIFNCRWLDPLYPVCPPPYHQIFNCRWFDPLVFIPSTTINTIFNWRWSDPLYPVCPPPYIIQLLVIKSSFSSAHHSTFYNVMSSHAFWISLNNNCLLWLQDLKTEGRAIFENKIIQMTKKFSVKVSLLLLKIVFAKNSILFAVKYPSKLGIHFISKMLGESQVDGGRGI